MDLRLETRRDADAVIVSVHGEVDNVTAPQLRQALLSAMHDDARLTVVDLSVTDFMDSSGLGALVTVSKQHHDNDRKLVIVCPRPHLRKIFQISHLDEVIDVYDDLGAALARSSSGD